MWKYNTSEELYHYGILGMHWGVRRFKNNDGSLTKQGLKRYNNMTPDEVNKDIRKSIRQKRITNGNKRGWINQFREDNFIGPSSKEATEYYKKEYNRIWNKSDKKYKILEKKLKNKEITFEQWNTKTDKIDDQFMREIESLPFTYCHDYGKAYSYSALNNIGKLNASYLKDLGYNSTQVESINNILMKSKQIRIQ